MRRKSLSDGVFDMGPAALFIAALCSSGSWVPSSAQTVAACDPASGIMRCGLRSMARFWRLPLAAYCWGLHRLSAPISPMTDTEAGLRAVPPPPPAAMKPAPVAPNAPIGAPIVPPGLVAPARPNRPVSSAPAAQAAPHELNRSPDPEVAAPEPAVQCHVDACAAAYHSFRASDCTYKLKAGHAGSARSSSRRS